MKIILCLSILTLTLMSCGTSQNATEVEEQKQEIKTVNPNGELENM
jgi:hypothetical protein